ncbi:MAG: hypothetical protein QGD94_06600 [Planctomycetia bacterium]|nr:hypothetical protein [Planctomycetia bacterium]
MAKRLTCCAVIMLACVVLFLLPARARAEDFPKNIDEIRLRNLRWQGLPEPVCGVYVGPDGRVWYELDHPRDTAEDPSEARRIIVREFGKKSPQLFGARPALFGPGGRVWFSVADTVILGYDGKRWIERRLQQDHSFTSSPANHGRYLRNGCSLYLGGVAFFPDSGGVHSFDGNRCPYEAFSKEKLKNTKHPVLVPDFDGKGVVAFVPDNRERLWRWRKGRWKVLPLPPNLVTSTIKGAGVRGHGVWIFTKRRSAVFISFGVETGALFPALLKKLGDDDYQRREKATREMIGLGPGIMAAVHKTLADTDDPEVRWRLGTVFEALKGSLRGSCTLGPYELRKASLYLLEPDGTMYVGAQEIYKDGKLLGAGLVVDDARGNRKLLLGRKFDRSWRSPYVEMSGPLVVKPGSLIWLPGNPDPRSGHPPRLLDVKKGEFVAEAPHSIFHWLYAVKPDGTLFVGRRETRFPAEKPVMVFTPGAPEEAAPAAGDKD